MDTLTNALKNLLTRQEDHEKASEMKHSAMEAYAAEDYQKAISIYTDIIKSVPTANAFAGRGECMRFMRACVFIM
jgi:hypothetical protein